MFANSLIKHLIEEFNSRYELGIDSFMELDKIDKDLNEIDRKYEALKNFTKNRYSSEQLYNALLNIDNSRIKEMLQTN